LIILAVFAFTFDARANDADGLLTKKYEACNSKALSTLDLHSCIGAEVKVQDARLNLAYRALAADLTPIRAKQLLEVQRSWIKFRDENCSFYLDPEGGTIASVRAGLCTMNLTASRAKELEDFLKP
jgi:uncharacterized protein YecT (DUF1311 family)